MSSPNKENRKRGFAGEPKNIYGKYSLLSLEGCVVPGRFKAYMGNIQKKTGKKPEDFLNLANKKGFIKEGKIVVKHADMLTWLKADMGLGHVQTNFMILYFRLRTNDPNVSEQAKKWAYETGYLEYYPKS